MNQEATVLHADPDDTTRQLVRSYLESTNQHNLEKNLEELLTIEGGFVERFNFFSNSSLPTSANRLLRPISSRFVATQFPAPGFVRVLIQK